MTWPKISWYCATWRRPLLLNEMIECFLRQDYPGEKELIILNDEPEQHLVFDHPEVRIFNWPHRIQALHGKLNMAASECTGEILFPTDDDDIFLPHRSRVCVEGLAGGVFKPSVFLIDTDPIRPVTGRLHCGYAFSRKRLMAAGMYQHRHGAGRAGDGVLCTNIDFQMRFRNDRCKPVARPYYLYRKFGLNISHVSTTWAVRKGALEEDVQKGEITLDPGWTQDWEKTCSAVDCSAPEPVFLHDPCFLANDKMWDMHQVWLDGLDLPPDSPLLHTPRNTPAKPLQPPGNPPA